MHSRAGSVLVVAVVAVVAAAPAAGIASSAAASGGTAADGLGQPALDDWSGVGGDGASDWLSFEFDDEEDEEDEEEESEEDDEREEDEEGGDGEGSEEDEDEAGDDERGEDDEEEEEEESGEEDGDDEREEDDEAEREERDDEEDEDGWDVDWDDDEREENGDDEDENWWGWLSDDDRDDERERGDRGNGDRGAERGDGNPGDGDRGQGDRGSRGHGHGNGNGNGPDDRGNGPDDRGNDDSGGDDRSTGGSDERDATNEKQETDERETDSSSDDQQVDVASSDGQSDVEQPDDDERGDDTSEASVRADTQAGDGSQEEEDGDDDAGNASRDGTGEPGPDVGSANVTVLRTPSVVGQPLVVEATTTNEGTEAGRKVVQFEVEHEIVDRRSFVLQPKETRTVTFEHVFETPGNKTFEVDAGRNRFVTVGERRANLSVSAVEVEPGTVAAGEDVTVTAVVSNVGHANGSLPVTLELFGEVVAVENVTLATGETREVSFTRSVHAPGTYEAVVDDESAEFRVTGDAGNGTTAATNESVLESAAETPGFGPVVALAGVVVAVALALGRRE